MLLGNGFKNDKEYFFYKRNNKYLIKDEEGKAVYQTYEYLNMINYFDNTL